MLSSFLLLYANLCGEEERTYAYIRASALWTLYLFVVTQLLSLPGQLRPVPLFCVWFGTAVVLLGLLIYRKKYRHLLPHLAEFT